MLAIQIVMPSDGDMTLLKQDGGSILLQPMFFGGDCAGPHLRVLDVTVETDKDGVTKVVGKPKILATNRIKIKSDGRMEIKHGETAESLQ